MPAGKYAKSASSMLFKSHIGGGGNNNPGKDPHIHIGPSQLSRFSANTSNPVTNFVNVRNPFLSDMRNPFASRSNRPSTALQSSNKVLVNAPKNKLSRFNWQ